MSLAIPLEILIPLILVIVILATIFWILYRRNKKIFEKLKSEKEKLFLYKQNIQNLEHNKNPKKTLNELNTLARKFFKEYFGLNQNLTYLELEKRFSKKGKSDYAKFCKLMSDAEYSGKELTEIQMKNLISLFSNIVNEY